MGDLFADPTPLVIGTSGQYSSPHIDNTTHGTESNEPFEYPENSTHSTWWVYTPRTDGDLHVYTENHSLGDGINTAIAVYLGEALDSLSFAGANNMGSWNESDAELVVPVNAGNRYHIQVSTGQAMLLHLFADGPQSMGTYLDTPPIGIRAGLLVPFGPDTQTVDAEPLVIGLDVAADDPRVVNIYLDAPPIGAGVSVKAPVAIRLARTLMSPLGGAVPTARPAFTVAVTQLESTLPGIYLDVQYADNSGFAAATTLTGNFALLKRTNSYTFTATSDLAAGTWFWRARLRAEDATLPWSDAASFTITPTAGSDTCDLVWVVVDAPTQPHLWQVEPTSGAVGDEITLYGQGFPDASDSTRVVRFNGTPIAATWRTVDPTGATDRAIDIPDLIDAGHDEVTVVMPEVEPGVGGFTVEGA